MPDPVFKFDNSYARDLEGLYVDWIGDKVPAPEIIQFNPDLARELGLDPATLVTKTGAGMLAGSTSIAGAHPLAQAYAGHQFGGFSPQLGDGRAILLGEMIDTHGQRRDLHLKGSGRTPFSRGGDGKAVIGPVLREYVMGEAMHALGIPTTRALAAVLTGEQIERQGPKPGAVLARVASSHLRVGTFQFFAARKDIASLRKLADYAIARHDPALIGHDAAYLEFLKAVIARQARLIAQWNAVGFVHGVMNTDNMTISGETIDYGPCAFIDAYDPAAVFSSIDQNGRYAFGRQASIAQWNLARLAEALLPLIDADDSDAAVASATAALEGFSELYGDTWLGLMCAKIGLDAALPGDDALVDDMLSQLEQQSVDFTQFFRALAASLTDGPDQVTRLFDDPTGIKEWLHKWAQRCQRDATTPAQQAAAMNACNPVYIPRNHLIEGALSMAENGDYADVRTLLEVLKTPFTPQADRAEYERPAPADFGAYKTFCGT